MLYIFKQFVIEIIIISYLAFYVVQMCVQFIKSGLQWNILYAHPPTQCKKRNKIIVKCKFIQ